LAAGPGELAEVRWVSATEAAELMSDMSEAVRRYLRRTLGSLCLWPSSGCGPGLLAAGAQRHSLLAQDDHGGEDIGYLSQYVVG
jgi:hypothetical protein